MSRSCYSDEFGDEFPGQLELYRANVARSIRSKAGQARLRELRDALLALPVKALEANTFADGTRDAPNVCALGAWALKKCDGDPQAAKQMVPREADDWDTFNAIKAHGWPRLVVLEAIYQNDEATYRVVTPEQRYAHVLAWVESQIVGGARQEEQG